MSISIDRITELAKTVEVTEDVEGYTAYGIAKVINETLAALGVEETVQPQQVYNDSTNGRVNGVKAPKGVKVRYAEEEVELYVAKFVASRVRGGKAVQESSVETADEEFNNETDDLETDEGDEGFELDENDGQGTSDNSPLV